MRRAFSEDGFFKLQCIVSELSSVKFTTCRKLMKTKVMQLSHTTRNKFEYESIHFNC